MSIYEIIGWVGVGVYVLGSIPYFRDTFHGETRPNRVTWFGWGLLTWTSALIQSAHGADASVLVIYTAALYTTAIFILSLYRGVTTFSRLDAVSLVLGLSAYVFWLILDAPALALIVNVIADFLFAIPTIVKVWKMPKSESQLSWFLGFISLGLALASKTNFDFINTAFPLYLFILNALVVILTLGFVQRLIKSQNIAL